MYRALISFSGLISMAEGDVGEISDIAIANDLLKAGYIEKIEDKPTIKRQKKGMKKDG